MAIAFGTNTHQEGSSSTSASFSHSAVSSAGGTILFACVVTSTASSSMSATYNGVAMTAFANNPSNADNFGNLVWGFYIYNPPSGSHTVSVSWTGSSSWEVNAYDYSDTSAAGTGVVAQNAFTTPTTAASEALTPTVTNQWMTALVCSQGTDATANTNCIRRSPNSFTRNNAVFDSNNNVLTASSLFTMTQTLGGNHGNMLAAIFDIPAASPSSNIKSIDAISRASIKSMNGVVLASIKSVNGVTN